MNAYNFNKPHEWCAHCKNMTNLELVMNLGIVDGFIHRFNPHPRYGVKMTDELQKEFTAYLDCKLIKDHLITEMKKRESLNSFMESYNVWGN